MHLKTIIEKYEAIEQAEKRRMERDLVRDINRDIGYITAFLGINSSLSSSIDSTDKINTSISGTEDKCKTLEHFGEMFQITEYKDLSIACEHALEQINFDDYNSKKITNEKEIQIHWSQIMKALELDEDLIRENIAVHDQNNTSSKQDILFYEYEPANYVETGHSGLCAQWNGLLPIELKLAILTKEKNLNCKFSTAVTEIHRDANHSKNGQAKFGVIGDGKNWVFTETYIHKASTLTNLFKYPTETIDYDSCAWFLRTLKNILLFIKNNRPNLLMMTENYKIGDYVSQNFIHVQRTCGVIKFTNTVEKNVHNVFKVVCDDKWSS